MKKIYLISGAVVVVAIIVVAVVSLAGGADTSTSSSQATVGDAYQTVSAGSPAASSTRVLFTDSPFAANAYLISTDTYDARTQQALSGFRVDKKTLADGSLQITLNAQNTEYQTQTYVVKPGEKLYFIERSLGDDMGSQDINIHDDRALLVDASGYIVQ